MNYIQVCMFYLGGSTVRINKLQGGLDDSENDEGVLESDFVREATPEESTAAVEESAEAADERLERVAG